MVKTKKAYKKGGIGIIRAIGRPVGKATLALGESIGKDYMQKKIVKVANGIYDDPSLAKNKGFLLTANKPLSSPNLSNSFNDSKYYSNNQENISPNIGGKSKKRRKSRRNIRKSRRQRK